MQNSYLTTTNGIVEKLDEVNKTVNSNFENVKKSSQDLSEKLVAQTKILNAIKNNQPVEKKAHTIIGKFLQKITKIEVLAVIIALLQLLIALPQLKVAYNAIFHDETLALKKTFTNFINHTDELVLIEIPDSLKTPEIIEIQDIQRKLFFNLKTLSQSENALAYFLTKKDGKDGNYRITDGLLSMIQLGECCEEINQIERTITNRYAPTNKNTGDNNLSQEQKIMIIYSSFTKLSELNTMLVDIKEKLSELVNSKKDSRNVENYVSFLKKKMPVDDFINYINLQDEVGLNYVNALNQIIYYLAYIK